MQKGAGTRWNQSRIKGGQQSNCPGPPLRGGAPWWNFCLSNEILVWKIFVIQKRYRNITLYYVPMLRLVSGATNSNWFLYKLDSLPVLVIAT